MTRKSHNQPTAPYHQIRATFTDSTIVVYQAYKSSIADAAIRTQSLNVLEFNPDRMTWVKPSFRWMLYRSGWARKENQERILAIHLTREAWEQALSWSGLKKDNACVRIQWDPERDIKFEPLPWRSIQVGLSGVAVKEGLLGAWTVKIEDATDVAIEIGKLVDAGHLEEAERLLPAERVYEFLDDNARIACNAC